MSEDSGIKVVRMHRFDGDSKTKAFADVEIGDFIIKGLRVVDGEKGIFLSMPREQGKDGKWYDTVRPVSKEAKDKLASVVLSAYQE
ncbi:MAG: SpoVG family protein [Candidatus Omnitrophota bacterium]